MRNSTRSCRLSCTLTRWLGVHIEYLVLWKETIKRLHCTLWDLYLNNIQWICIRTMESVLSSSQKTHRIHPKEVLKFALWNFALKCAYVLPAYGNRLKLLNTFTLKILTQCNFTKEMSECETTITLCGRSFFSGKDHSTKYGTHEPINFMCILFNKFYDLLDFSLSVGASRFNLLNSGLRECFCLWFRMWIWCTV